MNDTCDGIASSVASAIGDVLSAWAWPILIVIVILLARRNGILSDFRLLLSALEKRIREGSKFSIGPSGITVEQIPPGIAAGTVEQTTAEGVKGANLSNISKDIIDQLQEPTGVLTGTIGTYPYLLHTATQTRPRTTQNSGRWATRVWIEVAPDFGFPATEIKRVIYRIEGASPGKNVITTMSSERQFELWLSLYGEFTIIAVVEKTDGSFIWLSRYLDLPGRPPD